MADLNVVKSNVAKMVSMNAPESDIDSYIQAEGTTVDAIKNFQSKSVTPLDYWVVNPAKNAVNAYVNDAKDMINSVPKNWGDVGNIAKTVGKSLFDHPVDNLTSTVGNLPNTIPDMVMNHPLQTAAMVLPGAEGTISTFGNAAKGVANAATNTGRYFTRVKSTFNPQAIENLNVPAITRLNNLVNTSQQSAEAVIKPLQEGIDATKQITAKSLQNISYQTKDLSTQTKIAIQDSRRVLKQNVTKFKDELQDISEEKAVEFQHKLPDFFDANGEAYGNARDAAISKMNIEGKGITYQEVQNTIQKTKKDIKDALVPSDAPAMQQIELLEKKYSTTPEVTPSTILGVNELPITESTSSRASQFVDATELIQDLRNVKNTLSSGAKSGRTGFNQEDLAVGYLDHNLGDYIKAKVPGFAQLQSEYTPVIRAMKKAHEVFKPNQGDFNTITATNFLKRAGTGKLEAGQERLLETIESGSKFSSGVGNLSVPVKEVGAKLQQTVQQSQKQIQSLQDNLTSQLKKLEIQKRSIIGKSQTEISKNQNLIKNREDLLKQRMDLLEERKKEVIRLNANKNVAAKLKNALIGKGLSVVPGGDIVNKLH